MQHLRPDMRPDVAAPWELLCVQIAERFGAFPWDVDEQPAPKVLRWVAIMSAENRARADCYGLRDDEPMVRIRANGRGGNFWGEDA